MMHQTTFTEEMLDILEFGSKAERKSLCKSDIACFALYYFSEYFKFKIPPFHMEMYEALRQLAEGELTEVAFIMFRESAKTSITKIFVLWCIVFKKKAYISYDSYNKENAEAALFDIASYLQINKFLIEDYGRLYTKKVKSDETDPSLRRIGNFLTKNKVRVEAFSTQESTRGRIYKEHRPDLFILDDIETSKTKDSVPTTQKIIEHVDELKSGLGTTGAVIYLGNFITENGSIAHIRQSVKAIKTGRVIEVPVVDDEGRIAWPDKYVKTDAEAEEANKSIDDKERRKVSLETKERTLKKSVYAAEMMNDPAAAGDTFFDRHIIDALIRRARAPLEEKAGVRYFYKYNPSHRYAIGADTSMGVGLDSNASAGIDFSTNPNRLAISYDSNVIAPDVFAYELKRQGNEYGECLLAPERNSESGGTCVNQLKQIYPIEKIYRVVPPGKVMNKLSMKVGWETTTATKPEMLFQLKSAVEDGKLEILDIRILKEMRKYSQADLATASNTLGGTRHYDLVMAVAIAWAMRDYAAFEGSKPVAYEQPAYEAPFGN